jgi:hypothetical protein
MGKQIGQSGNFATSPPAPAIRVARASSRSNPRAPSTTFAPRSASRSRLAYSAARAGNHDELVFDSRHKVLLSTFKFLQRLARAARRFLSVTSERLQFFFVHERSSVCDAILFPAMPVDRQLNLLVEGDCCVADLLVEILHLIHQLLVFD